ncbi:Fe2+-dependent dioxygenase [Coralloluteibacterium stylophorae]|uniref:Fe2+-dependent dioxygenase n=1 Tax=Coralloluteibacterium stylophorae TaxID=1776034 RepID=A0A8J8AXN1_9GAMM|nr:Fe2+-dependent dioxygenase [Coralloluteibacterium stylophorae]MBS7456973.1 Fe2+-dependent dioxygenase [Coralloluteibacterium stylophorae]
MLLHIPGILGREELDRFRHALARADWTDGRETVGAQGAQVKRNLQLPEDSAVRRELGAHVLAALARSPLYHAAALPARTLPPRFNRYEGGGHYGFHVDGAVMATADGRQLRSDVSCTLFLADPDEYDGGALIVHDTYGEHEVKLPAGDLVVYPSSSLHRVEPVTRGARLAAFFWVQSLVRDDARRQMLFELDAAIQALTASGADRDALLRLTGVYHNLLRQWAET